MNRAAPMLTADLALLHTLTAAISEGAGLDETGLGLSICHGIVTSLGGEISVSSCVGKGTTFEVALPIGAPAVTGPSPTREGPRPGSRARVLVVDDEISLVKSTVRMLATQHDASGTSDPHELLARLRAGESFDAIICDLMMPQLTGGELYREVKRIAPSIAQRIVIATGGAFTHDAAAFLDEVNNPVLEKPFQRATLLDVIRQIVEKTN